MIWNADRWQLFMGAARRLDEMAWQAEDPDSQLRLVEAARAYAWAAHPFIADLKTIPHVVKHDA